MTDLETFARALRNELHSMADEKGYSHQQRMFVLDLGNRFDRALASVQKPEACEHLRQETVHGTTDTRCVVCGAAIKHRPAPAAKSKYKINRDLAGDGMFAVSYDGVWQASFRSECDARNWVRALEAQDAQP